MSYFLLENSDEEISMLALNIYMLLLSNGKLVSWEAIWRVVVARRKAARRNFRRNYRYSKRKSRRRRRKRRITTALPASTGAAIATCGCTNPLKRRHGWPHAPAPWRRGGGEGGRNKEKNGRGGEAEEIGE